MQIPEPNTEDNMALEWIPLEREEQLEEIRLKSHEFPCVIFKHSTRCSISTVVLQRLNNTPAPSTKASYFYLDLLKFRPISNKIAELFQIHHESPQVLVIDKGECRYEETHLGIEADELQEQLNKILSL
jgi:bacillithiol system protein YtxJ